MMIKVNHKPIKPHIRNSKINETRVCFFEIADVNLNEIFHFYSSSEASERDSDSESSHRSTDKDFEIVNSDDVDTS